MGVLGWLFKFQSESDNKNELLIFITPRIVRLEQKRL
jgi:type IV pilus assembly protein PilQ